MNIARPVERGGWGGAGALSPFVPRRGVVKHTRGRGVAWRGGAGGAEIEGGADAVWFRCTESSCSHGNATVPPRHRHGCPRPNTLRAPHAPRRRRDAALLWLRLRRATRSLTSLRDQIWVTGQVCENRVCVRNIRLSNKNLLFLLKTLWCFSSCAATLKVAGAGRHHCRRRRPRRPARGCRAGICLALHWQGLTGRLYSAGRPGGRSRNRHLAGQTPQA